MHRLRVGVAFLAIAVVVSSCSDSSGQTGGATTSSRRLATTTWKPASPTESSLTSTPANATTTTISEAGTGVVVSESGFLGAWTGSRWVRWDDAAFSADGLVGRPLRLGRLGHDPVVSRVMSVTEGCSDLGGPRSIALPIGWPNGAPDLDAPSAVAVVATQTIVPRPIKMLDPNNPTYIAAVRHYVGAQPVVIDQLVRTDLDGDGTDEVIIVARHPRLDPKVTPLGGEYSIVLIRRIERAAVTTIALQHNVDPVPKPDDGPYPSSARNHIDAIADLNGDGAMEIVVSSRWFESHASAVYEPSSKTPSDPVLENACGV